MKKTLYLMRHGQTLFNLRKKVQGWCDAPLTELGKQQALIAGEYFKKNQIEFDAAYCSTSERASDTLELVTDMNYKRVKGLKEWNFGLFEGESEDLNPSLPYGDFFVAYGGEGEMEFRNRVFDTLLKIMKEEEGNVVFAVSHGAACAQFSRHHNNKSHVGEIKGIRNCCILTFEFEEDGFTLLEIVNHDFSGIH